MDNDLPPFRDDGYLPVGLYHATLESAVDRFETGSRRRRYLVFRLKRWVEIARAVAAPRLFIDGSFVTSKNEPDDIDAVVLLPPDFRQLVFNGTDAAVELDHMLLNRMPEEIFAAEDDEDWNEWIEFFSQTRESDNRKKGLVEIVI